MVKIDLNYNDWKSTTMGKGLPHFSFIKNDSTMLLSIDGSLHFFHNLDEDDRADYENNFSSTSNSKLGNYYSREPFATKVLKDGTKLFRRKHGYEIEVPANSSGVLEANVEYARCKINKLEIIDANPLDEIDLIILDTPTGLISSIPDYPLNQFGFSVKVSSLLYSDKSDYDAELLKDMKVKVVYRNKTNVSKKVGINVTFHEMV